jgi:hypothetical protein
MHVLGKGFLCKENLGLPGVGNDQDLVYIPVSQELLKFRGSGFIRGGKAVTSEELKTDQKNNDQAVNPPGTEAGLFLGCFIFFCHFFN